MPATRARRGRRNPSLSTSVGTADNGVVSIAGRPRSRKLLWIGAAVTAAAAIFFPRIQGIRAENESWWRLLWFFVPQDVEGVVLVPIVVVLTLALFALVGRRAWDRSDDSNRPAKTGLVCSLLGFVGVLAFFLSAPILLGGLGATLGIEGYRRAAASGRGSMAIAAIVLGALSFAVGASMWALGEEFGI